MATSSDEIPLVEQLSDGKLLNVEECDSVCVIRFVEPMLRDADRPQHVKRVLGLLTREYSRFVVNMSPVRYCSSLVLGSLVLLRNTAHESGGQVHVCGVTGQVAELFAVTGMDSLFQSFETEEDAVADLAHV